MASLVRGRSVADALTILEHTPKRAAKPLSKVIASAQANATHTYGLKSEGLIIKSLQVTTGTRLKRFRPAAKGRALPFELRTSHIRVEVSGEVKPKKKPVTAKSNSAAESVATKGTK